MMAGIGHNSDDAAEDILSGAAQRQLKSIIERVERLNQEKAELLETIKEVFAEAKGNGFDVKTLRKVIKIRSMDPAKRLEEEAILDLYLSATGDLVDFEPAKPRAKETPAEAGGVAGEDDYNDIA